LELHAGHDWVREKDEDIPGLGAKGEITPPELFETLYNETPCFV
jgi:hypothetical protein